MDIAARSASQTRDSSCPRSSRSRARSSATPRSSQLPPVAPAETRTDKRGPGGRAPDQRRSQPTTLAARARSALPMFAPPTRSSPLTRRTSAADDNPRRALSRRRSQRTLAATTLAVWRCEAAPLPPSAPRRYDRAQGTPRLKRQPDRLAGGSRFPPAGTEGATVRATPRRYPPGAREPPSSTPPATREPDLTDRVDDASLLSRKRARTAASRPVGHLAPAPIGPLLSMQDVRGLPATVPASARGTRISPARSASARATRRAP